MHYIRSRIFFVFFLNVFVHPDIIVLLKKILWRHIKICNDNRWGCLTRERLFSAVKWILYRLYFFLKFSFLIELSEKTIFTSDLRISELSALSMNASSSRLCLHSLLLEATQCGQFAKSKVVIMFSQITQLGRSRKYWTWNDDGDVGGCYRLVKQVAQLSQSDRATP